MEVKSSGAGHRRLMPALLGWYVVLACLIMMCTCQASSNSDIVGSPSLAKMADTNVPDTIAEENDAVAVAPNTHSSDEGADDENVERDSEELFDPVESITDKLSTWMKDKRKKNKRKKQEFKDDILQQQKETPNQGPALPFVTLAFAQTLDGMIAARCSDGDGESTTTTSNLRLSSPQSMILTHQLRNMHDAILVGGSTFLLDTPRLNVRLPVDSFSHGVEVEHPMPIVLDTKLNTLQQLLFDKIVSDSFDEEETLPDISIDTIKAHNPIICCSSNAAQCFLDILEVFQDQQTAKVQRKRKKSYGIIVYKKIDYNNDHEEDIYLPIKITIHVTRHNKKGEDDVVQDVTLTLLPCQTNNENEQTDDDETTSSSTQSESLNLQHALHQLYSQFSIESVMVEGGAGILSSFMNACCSDDNRNSSSKVVDCICVTVAPKIMGGKWGLPVFGGLDATTMTGSIGVEAAESQEHDDSSDGEDKIDETQQSMMSIKEGEFVSLGSDCIFFGKL